MIQNSDQHLTAPQTSTWQAATKLALSSIEAAPTEKPAAKSPNNDLQQNHA